MSSAAAVTKTGSPAHAKTASCASPTPLFRHDRKSGGSAVLQSTAAARPEGASWGWPLCCPSRAATSRAHSLKAIGGATHALRSTPSPPLQVLACRHQRRQRRRCCCCCPHLQLCKSMVAHMEPLVLSPNYLVFCSLRHWAVQQSATVPRALHHLHFASPPTPNSPCNCGIAAAAGRLPSLFLAVT